MTIYKYLVDLPFAAASLGTGFTSLERYNKNRLLAYSLIGAKTNLITETKRFSDSYTNSKAPTILHYRDYILAIALQESLVNTQFSLPTSSASITKHAAQVWNSYSYDDIWDYLPLDGAIPEYKYAGLLGTPAYWFTRVDLDNLYPIEGLLSICSMFWRYQGSDTITNPYSRTQNLYEALDLSDVLFQLPAAVWTPSTYSVRNLVSASDYVDFRNRVILGEYSNESLIALQGLMEDVDLNRIEAAAADCLSLAKPGGYLLCLQFLIVEAFTLVAQILTNLDEAYLTLPAATLFTIDALKPTRLLIAKHLTTAYDAYLLQAKYNSLTVASSKAEQALSFIATFLGSTDETSIFLTDDYRLYTATAEIDLTQQQASGEYAGLLGLQSRGVIFLSSNVYAASQVTLTTNTASNIVQIDLETNDTAQTSIVTTQSNSTTVGASTTGYGAFYASTENSGVVPYETYSTDPSASNVVVVSFSTPTPVGADSNTAADISGSLDSYITLQSIGSSRADQQIMDTRLLTNIAQNDILQNRETAAAFGSQIAKQVTDIHIDSELSTLEAWSKSIGHPLPTAYKDSVTDFQTSYAALQKSSLEEDYGSGNGYTTTTAREVKKAQSWTFIAGTTFTARANATQFIAEHFIVQAKNSYNQSFFYKGSHKYSWERAQESLVKQSASIYNYATIFNGSLAANAVNQIGNNTQYSDYLSLQVGQDKDPISANAVLGGAYGTADINIQQDFNITTKKGQFVVRSKDRASITTEQSLQLQAQNSFLLGSTINGSIQTGVDLSMSAKGITSVSGIAALNLSSNAVASLMAPMIYIGIGGGGDKPITDLTIPEDQAAGLSEALSGTTLFSDVFGSNGLNGLTAFATATNFISGDPTGAINNIFSTVGNSLGIDASTYATIAAAANYDFSASISPAVQAAFSVLPPVVQRNVAPILSTLISGTFPVDSAINILTTEVNKLIPAVPATGSFDNIENLIPYDEGSTGQALSYAFNGDFGIMPNLE